MPDLVNVTSAATLFLNYRRDDTGTLVPHLVEHLARAFDEPSIFYDRESLLAGDRWKERLSDEIARARVFLALIGSRWLKGRNEASGQRRLDEADDWVRTELELALTHAAHGLLIVPVLVDGELLPKAEFLPASIRRLEEHQAVTLRSAPRQAWEDDLTTLLETLQRKGIVTAVRPAPEQTARITVRKDGPTGAPLFEGHAPLVRIGRDPSSEVVLEQPASWEHGRIVLAGGVFVYQHLGQRAVAIRRTNGRRVDISCDSHAEETLRQNDLIEVSGSTRLSVQFQLPPATGYTPTE